MRTWKEIKQHIKAVETDEDRLALAVWYIQDIADNGLTHPDKAKLILAAVRR